MIVDDLKRIGKYSISAVGDTFIDLEEAYVIMYYDKNIPKSLLSKLEKEINNISKKEILIGKYKVGALAFMQIIQREEIIEIDVNLSTDGKLYGETLYLEEISSSEILFLEKDIDRVLREVSIITRKYKDEFEKLGFFQEKIIKIEKPINIQGNILEKGDNIKVMRKRKKG